MDGSLRADTAIVGEHDAEQPAIARKGHQAENFPVASWLLPKPIRREVMAYYRFARHADDIADDPDRSAASRVRLLDQLDEALKSDRRDTEPDMAPAAVLRPLLAARNIPLEHASELLIAFRRDARGIRCTDWADLMLYCRYSASPVGRFLLDLHGEDRSTWESSDALCNALQVLNHLQDCKDDLIKLDRCYIPADFLGDAGADDMDLRASVTSAPLRAALDRTLAETATLLELARQLPHRIKGMRMRCEAAAILEAGLALHRLLCRSDPLARRCTVSKLGRLVALGRGLLVAVIHLPPSKPGIVSIPVQKVAA